MLANKLTPCGHEGCEACGDSAFWVLNYGLVAHDRGSIPELEKRMLPDGSGGYVVSSNGAWTGWPHDYWGRVYNCWPPRADCLVHDPAVEPMAICMPPPCAQPTPVPTPQPSPVPNPSPSVPSSGAIIPKLHECPAEWVGMKPDHVKLNRHPWRAPANPNGWIFNTSPIMERADYCLDEHGNSRGVPCEGWGPCFENNLYRPAARAWGPGWPADGDEVERRSNNAWLLFMLVGPDGTPAGRYRVCVAPTDAELLGPNAECSEFDLSLP